MSPATVIPACLLGVCLSLASPPLCASEAKWESNLYFLLGQKSLSNEWGSLGNQHLNALRFDFKRENWPINIVLEISHSSTEKSQCLGDCGPHSLNDILTPGIGATALYDNQASTSELAIGVQKYWDGKDALKPFVAGGVTVVHGTLISTEHVSGFSEHVRSVDELGHWIEVGVVKNKYGFTVGATMKWSTATILLNNIEMEGGGLHLGLLIGYRWQ